MTLKELAAKVREALAGYPAAYRELKQIGRISTKHPHRAPLEPLSRARRVKPAQPFGKHLVEGDKRLVDALGSSTTTDRASRN